MKAGPGHAHGTVAAPPSKSVTIRALVGAALAPGTSTILGPSHCSDVRSAVTALSALGAELSSEGDSMRVRGTGGVRSDAVECGESALCMRMLAPVAAALTGKEMLLTAAGSLACRPMGMLEAPLRAFGAECTTDRGHAPVRVRGPLAGGHAVVDASTTSQLLTGLLFALPLCARDSEVEVPAMASGQYVAMTLDVLKSFGIRIEHEEGSGRFGIPGGQSYVAGQFTTEGDWSAAAFLLVAGAIAGDVEVTGLRTDCRQPDARVVDVLRQCGADVALQGGVRASSRPLNAFRYDVSDAPDLLPPLVALACSCRGTSELSGIERTRLKESDRVAALCQALGSLGAAIEVDHGRMRVTGGPLRGGAADSFGDHRIAMAVAVAALRAEGTVELRGAECVAKSYPTFFDDLRVLLR